MALLTSPLQFSRGKILNVSFYQDQNGRCIARHHPGEVKDFYTNPNRRYQVNSAQEFGTNAKAARSIRLAFATYLKCYSDSTYFNRLMGLLRVASDEHRSAARGTRDCFSGNIHLLSGFEFNKKCLLVNSLNTEYSTSINPSTGAMRVELASFRPSVALKPPAGARYFQIIAVGAAVSHDKPVKVTEVSDLLRIDSGETGPVNLSLQLGDHTGKALLLGLGILYYEEYMGVPLMLRDGSFAIVDVEKAVPTHDGSVINESVLSAADRQAKRNAMQEQAVRAATSEFEFRFPVRGVATGATNKTPAADMTEKVLRLQRHLWLRRVDKFRRG